MPDAIRTQLANLPIHRPVSLVDLGTVTCEYENLEQAQSELAEQVANSLQNGLKPIVWAVDMKLHLVALAVCFQYVQAHAPDKKIGIINFDAHFDLREAEHATSGTPFYKQQGFQNSIKNNLITYVLGLPTMPILKFCLIRPML